MFRPIPPGTQTLIGLNVIVFALPLSSVMTAGVTASVKSGGSAACETVSWSVAVRVRPISGAAAVNVTGCGPVIASGAAESVTDRDVSPAGIVNAVMSAVIPGGTAIVTSIGPAKPFVRWTFRTVVPAAPCVSVIAAGFRTTVKSGCAVWVTIRSTRAVRVPATPGAVPLKRTCPAPAGAFMSAVIATVFVVSPGANERDAGA